MSTLGSDIVLVVGLRTDVNASGELLKRLRSIVFLLGTGTGFFGTLSSPALSTGNNTEVETGEPFSLLLCVTLPSADVIVRRLVGTGRFVTVRCSEEVVLVVVTAVVLAAVAVAVVLAVALVVVLVVVKSLSNDAVKDDVD